MGMRVDAFPTLQNITVMPYVDSVGRHWLEVFWPGGSVDVQAHDNTVLSLTDLLEAAVQQHTTRERNLR